MEANLEQYNTVEMVGRRFGALVVLERNGSDKHCVALWKCQCDCGKVVNQVNGQKLRAHRRKNCSFRCNGMGDLIKSCFYTNKKHAAEKKDLEWSIDHAFLVELLIKQNYKCAISGLDLGFRKYRENGKYKQNNTASIDRIDSSKGYTKDNVQWVHKHVNIMKNKFDEAYFFDLCKTIINYRENQNGYNRS